MTLLCFPPWNIQYKLGSCLNEVTPTVSVSLGCRGLGLGRPPPGLYTHRQHVGPRMGPKRRDYTYPHSLAASSGVLPPHTQDVRAGTEGGASLGGRKLQHPEWSCSAADTG